MRRSLNTIVVGCLRQRHCQSNRLLVQRNISFMGKKAPKPKGPETGLVFPKDPKKGGRCVVLWAKEVGVGYC